jgi:NADH:ubiquinone oxidoreductase subunit 5 (subunit L)/multisubunit Na+/H+ antiporter MnhA subunit
MSGATYENDLKKIIALSILRLLGLIIMILNIELNLLGFYCSITHAAFKFLRAGIIHLMKNGNLLRKSGRVTVLDEKNEEKVDTCNHQREKKRRELNTNLSFQ